MRRLACQRDPRRNAGFTLIEMILTMAITGILAGMVSVFISGPVVGYLGAAQRGELTDVADLTLRRLSREVSLALPNSLRVTASGGITYIEFIATSGGGAYNSESDTTAGIPLNYSDATACTTTPTNCQFAVAGPMPSNPAIVAGDYIVVYNLGQDASGNSYSPVDAYQCGAVPVPANCNMAKVSATPATANNSTVTLVAGTGNINVFANQSPPLPSPSNRFHVVPGGVRATAFACPTAPAIGAFNRYVNYGIYATAAAAITQMTTPALLANNASCTVSYTAAASQRNGLLSVTLTLSDTSGKESVSLMREIHLDNSP